MYDSTDNVESASVLSGAVSMIAKQSVHGLEAREAGGRPATCRDEPAMTQSNCYGLATVGGGQVIRCDCVWEQNPS